MKALDLTGLKFDRLVVIGRSDKTDKRGRIFWVCECKCGSGKLVHVSTDNLRRGNSKSCGCIKAELMDSKRKDIAGQTFGYLKAIRPTEKRYRRALLWQFECLNCGRTDVYYRVGAVDREGGTISCGCVKEADIQFRKENPDFYTNKMRSMQKLAGGSNASLTSPDVMWSHNTSGIRGVYYDKARNKWVAHIKFKQKPYYLGRFDTKEDAAKIRKQAEEMMFEPFLEWYEQLHSAKSQSHQPPPPPSPSSMSPVLLSSVSCITSIPE